MRLELWIIAVAGTLVGCASGWSAEDQRDQEWVQTRFPQALETLLPLDGDAALSCRVYRDYWVETPEYRLDLVGSEDESGALLVLVEPEKRSIWEQLRRAHHRDPERDLGEILAGVRLRTRRFTVAGCAALAGLERLDSKTVEEAPRPDSITIHPLVRQCLSPRGEIITITEGQHPAAVWLDRAYEAFESCGPAGGGYHRRAEPPRKRKGVAG